VSSDRREQASLRRECAREPATSEEMSTRQQPRESGSRIRPVAACGLVAGSATFRDQYWSATVRLNVLDLWAAIHRLPLYEAALHLAEAVNLPRSRRRGARDANPSSAADEGLAPGGLRSRPPEPTERSIHRSRPVCSSLDCGFWLRLWPCASGRAAHPRTDGPTFDAR
jgi:hypothetical protein